MKPPHSRHGGPGRPPGGPPRDPSRDAGARHPGSFRSGGGDERGARPNRPARDGAPRAEGGGWHDRPRRDWSPPQEGSQRGGGQPRPSGRDGSGDRFSPGPGGPDHRRGGRPFDRSHQDARHPDSQRPGAPPRREPEREQRPHGERPHGERSRPRGPVPSGPPPAPGGAIWLYGHHAVAAALANQSRRLRRLLVTEEGEAALAALLPPPWPLPVERTERGRLDHLLGREAVHQGVALLADPLAPPSLAQMLDRPGPVLVLDQVSDPRNIGAILRCAAAFGAAGVITQDRNAPEETGSLAKAASGALETVPLLRAVNIARTLIALKAADRWVVGLDAGGATPLAGPVLAGRRVALVLGAEGTGLRRLTRETCDELARLATEGAMESLNVAAAAAVALYELARRG